MPMDITFDEHALKYLTSPPKPCLPLRDIVLIVRKSAEINALAMIGRSVLRAYVMARTFDPPIASSFEIDTDARMEDARLARVVSKSGLLERLNIHGVATDQADIAQIFCAYLGATLRCGWKTNAVIGIHDSVNDLCNLVFDDNDDVSSAVENNSHERMMNIPNVEMMGAVKFEAPIPSPIPRRGQNLTGEMDASTNESVSSGRSPPPHLYGPHYQQPYQPYYIPNPSYPPPPPHPMQHVHMQSIPMTQRYGSYHSGPAPTSSPAFMPQQAQPGPSAFPAGHGAFPQYTSPSPMQPSAGWTGPQNPPSYGAGVQPPPPTGIPPPPPPTQQTQGFISLFNELAMKHRMAVSWQQQKSGQPHIPEWTMWLSVDGAAKGYGVAPTKQGAKEIAAKVALQAMGWLGP